MDRELEPEPGLARWLSQHLEVQRRLNTRAHSCSLVANVLCVRATSWTFCRKLFTAQSRSNHLGFRWTRQDPSVADHLIDDSLEFTKEIYVEELGILTHR